MGRWQGKEIPQVGKLYACRRHFCVECRHPDQPPMSFVIRKGTPLMLVSKDKSLGMHGYNYRRQWLDDDLQSSNYDVGGAVWVYTFLYSDKTWEIGFRDGDWGNEIKLWRPERDNSDTD